MVDVFVAWGTSSSISPQYRPPKRVNSRAVGRTPPNPCSRDRSPDPGFDVAWYVTTRHQRFTCVRLLETHLTKYSSAFSHNAHHQGSLPSQLVAVGSLPLQADSGGPSPISDKAFTAHNL